MEEQQHHQNADPLHQVHVQPNLAEAPKYGEHHYVTARQ
jgi:hypothetical protein